MYTLYGMTGSGNCYKPALLMKQLGIPFRWQEVNLLKGESHTSEFLALNPVGKVPTLVLPDSRTLSESNAMLCYLAEGSPMLPADRYARAQVLQWMFFEQYSHEPYIATVRFWIKFLDKREAWAEKIADARKKGVAALGVMEQQLAKTPFLTGEVYSVADIALYAYTHVAHEGDYAMDDYPAIRAWLRRIESQPGFERMA